MGGTKVTRFVLVCSGSPCQRDWLWHLQFQGGCCGCAKCCFEFGDGEYECGGVAEPDAGDFADGGDWDDILGGLAVSGVDEEVPRRHGRNGEGRADVWIGVFGRSDDAPAGAGVAHDDELAGREPDWDDIFVFIWAGGADLFGDGAATADWFEISELVFWSGGGNADGGVHELRGADCARILRGGDEQGVGAGCDVCFTSIECGGGGDDVRVVSGEGGGV